MLFSFSLSVFVSAQAHKIKSRQLNENIRRRILKFYFCQYFCYEKKTTTTPTTPIMTEASERALPNAPRLEGIERPRLGRSDPIQADGDEDRRTLTAMAIKWQNFID